MWPGHWWWVALIAVVAVRLVAFALRVEREHADEQGDDIPEEFSPVLFRTITPEDYVFVEDDGSSRELTPVEAAYLMSPFSEDEDEWPEVKASYDELSWDGKMGGFLARKLLPSEIAKAERFAQTLRSD